MFLLRPKGVSNKTQCAYKRTLRRLREVLFGEEKQYAVCVRACVCVCSIKHPARKSHAPDYIVVIYGLSGSTIFFHMVS